MRTGAGLGSKRFFGVCCLPQQRCPLCSARSHPVRSRVIADASPSASRSAVWPLLKAARVRLVTVVDLAVSAAADSRLHKRCRSRLRAPLLPSACTCVRCSVLQLHAVPMSRARRNKRLRLLWGRCCSFTRRLRRQRLLVTRGTRQPTVQAPTVQAGCHASTSGLLGPSRPACLPCACRIRSLQDLAPLSATRLWRIRKSSLP